MKPHLSASGLLAGALASRAALGAAAPVTPAQIAAVIADPKLGELSPAALTEAMRPIARLKDAQKADYQWTLSARAPRPGCKWVLATFEPDSKSAKPEAKDRWRLVSLQVGLVPVGGDEGTLAAALVEPITARLGKARREGKGWAWRLDGQRELYLLRGKETDPTSDPPVDVRVVALEVQSISR
jgi:hypothetical protein